MRLARGLFALLLLPTFVASAADDDKKPPVIAMNLGLSQEVYEAGQVVRGELTVTNTGAAWTTVPDLGDLARHLRLVPEGGKEIEPTKPERFGGAKTKELGPGGFAGITFDAALLFPALEKPGRYTLVFRRDGIGTREKKLRVIDGFDPAKKYKVSIALPDGPLVVEMFAQEAPVAVHNIVSLARTEFYDGADVSRIEPGAMVAIRGPVGPQHRIVPFEKGGAEFLAGTVLLEAAGSGEDRFNVPNLIVLLAPAPALQGRYTAVGQVVSGLEALQKLALRPTTGKPQFRPAPAVKVEKIRVS